MRFTLQFFLQDHQSELYNFDAPPYTVKPTRRNTLLHTFCPCRRLKPEAPVKEKNLRQAIAVRHFHCHNGLTVVKAAFIKQTLRCGINVFGKAK